MSTGHIRVSLVGNSAYNLVALLTKMLNMVAPVGVGKTCLAVRHAHSVFPTEYIPTVWDDVLYVTSIIFKINYYYYYWVRLTRPFSCLDSMLSTTIARIKLNYMITFHA